MRLLVGCETSAVVRTAFRECGHDAFSADLLPSDHGDSDPFHIQCDHDLHLLDIIADGKWDALIVHPPCKFLAASGMHWTTRGFRDPEDTLRAIKFAEALWSSNVSYIALENPTGALSTRSKLGKPAQSIQPFEFGHDASKKTCLWLKNLPRLTPTKYVAPRIVIGANGKKYERWANQTDSGQNKLSPSDLRWKERSRTYEGIAYAMADQWFNNTFKLKS